MKDYFLGFNRSSNDFTLHEYGEEQCKAGYTFGPYVRHTYFLHYVYEGRGAFGAEGKRYSLKKGQMFLICPGQVTIYGADEEQPWFYRWIAFDGAACRFLFESAKLSAQNPVFTDTEDMKVGKALKKIVDGGHMSFCRTMSLFWEFADALCSESKSMGAPLEYVGKAKAHIHSHYMESVSVKDIAKEIGIDRSYLSRLFKEKVGMSPQKYLILYRLSITKSLLEGTDLPVSEIAKMGGYADATDFSKIFRQYVGMSPAKWRNARKSET